MQQSATKVLERGMQGRGSQLQDRRHIQVLPCPHPNTWTPEAAGEKSDGLASSPFSPTSTTVNARNGAVVIAEAFRVARKNASLLASTAALPTVPAGNRFRKTGRPLRAQVYHQ